MPTAQAGSTIISTDQIAAGVIVNDDINSAAGIVDTKLATISTAGKVSGAAITSLSSIPAGAGVVPSANLPAAIKMRIGSMFEAAARWTGTVVSSGVNTFGVAGLAQTTGATGSSSAKVILELDGGDGQANIYDGSPTFSALVATRGLNLASGAGIMLIGLGSPAVAGAGITLTNKHIGFKIVKVGGVASLYATQANNVTETASAALTTVDDPDVLDLILVVNGTTSVDYYWRKNGGALSAATNLSTNMPGAASEVSSMQFAVSNQATAFAFTFGYTGMSYER